MTKIKFFIFFLCLMGCSSIKIQSPLIHLVPELKECDIKVIHDQEDVVVLELHEMNTMDSYIKECMDMGWNVDITQNDLYFNAFDQEANQIVITNLNSGYYTLEIRPSRILDTLLWTTDKLPAPNCEHGMIEYDDENQFSAYVELNVDQMKEYAETCIENGFKENTSSSTYFYGIDEKGNDLYISYLGANTVSITYVIKS